LLGSFTRQAPAPPTKIPPIAWGTAADVDEQITNFLRVINPTPNAIKALDGTLIALDFEQTKLASGSDDTHVAGAGTGIDDQVDSILGRKIVIAGRWITRTTTVIDCAYAKKRSQTRTVKCERSPEGTASSVAWKSTVRCANVEGENQ
jgi:hypothetical protein